MGRPKQSSNKKEKILYPRKCNHCEYVSNDPAMWHYHNKTHDSIPEGRLCDHGCGNQAIYVNTNKTYSCTKVSQQCPKYRTTHSERIREQWVGAEERKASTAESLRKRLHNEETVAKQVKTKRTKKGGLKFEDIPHYRIYARKARKLAQAWARSNGHEIGKSTYHVDHKVSVLEGWNNKLPLEIISHPVNLQILGARENSGKGAKSCMTIEELLTMIKQCAEQNGS